MAGKHSAALRYAKALFGLAQETGAVDSIRSELDGVVLAIANVPTLSDVLVLPIYPAAERRAALQQLAGPLALSPLLTNFLSFLID